MDIRSLGYVGINSCNVSAWQTWAPQILGFDINPPEFATPFHKESALAGGLPRAEGAVYLRMDDRAWRFAIYPGKREGELAFVGWELADRGAFLDALDHLSAQGVKFEIADEKTALERGVQGMAFFHDPAGFRHEIFYSAYFFEDSYVPGRRPMKKGFKTKGYGIGHIALIVPELTDELDRFARKVLGLRVFAGGTTIPLTEGTKGNMRRGRLEMYRGRKSLRSHLLVYLQSPGYRGVQHIFTEYEDLDDMGRAYDLVQKKSAFPLVLTLGRHQAEDYISFYCQTPSKLFFEVGWGTKPFDDDAWIQERPLNSFVWGCEMVGPVFPEHLKITEE